MRVCEHDDFCTCPFCIWVSPPWCLIYITHLITYQKKKQWLDTTIIITKPKMHFENHFTPIQSSPPPPPNKKRICPGCFALCSAFYHEMLIYVSLERHLNKQKQLLAASSDLLFSLFLVSLDPRSQLSVQEEPSMPPPPPPKSHSNSPKEGVRGKVMHAWILDPQSCHAFSS